MIRVPYAATRLARLLTLVVTCVLLLTAQSATAASVYTYTSGKAGQTGGDTIELTIDGSNMRMDDKVKGGMVFRADEDYMAILDHRDRQYVHLSPEQMEQLAARINPAMEAMRQQLEQLPPEQREMMKKMMESRMPQRQTQIEANLSATGEKDNYAGFDCEWWEMRRETELVRSACVADTGDVPNGAVSRETLRSMAAFQKKLFQAFENMPMAPSTTIFEEMQRIDGFPVATRDYRDGALSYETRLTAIGERDTTAEDFAPPADYSERALTGPQ